MPHGRGHHTEKCRERCLKRSREYKKERIALGYKSALSPIAYQKQLDANKRWNKAHLDSRRIASTRRNRLVKSVMGSISKHDCYLFKLLGGARAYHSGEMQKALEK